MAIFLVTLLVVSFITTFIMMGIERKSMKDLMKLKHQIRKENSNE